jgi:hypothetical protein
MVLDLGNLLVLLRVVHILPEVDNRLVVVIAFITLLR